MAYPLLGTLLVTAILGFLEASSGVSLLGGQLPKGPALGFVPKVVGKHPVCILSSHNPKLPLPRSPWLGTPGKEN